MVDTETPLQRDETPAADGSVLVAGTGPAGLVAALAFDHAGFDVGLVGPDIDTTDRRTTTLMHPVLRLLEPLGIGERLRRIGAPLRVMRIVDGTARLIRAPTVTFHASEIGEDYFGLNIPNAGLLDVLRDAVSSRSGIVRVVGLVDRWETRPDEVVAHLADRAHLAARLVVAADGRRSPARQAAGISISTRGLPQSALVLTFAHDRPHGSISTELHTETGPFTQVPLPGDRSSLVWVVEPETAKALQDLDDAELSLRVEQKMQSMLGRVRVEPGRQVYPLSSALPHAFARDRVALVGEAAHVFPPIGAQGLNLGIRDIDQLVHVAATRSDDPGCDDVLRDYDRRRRTDVIGRSTGVNLLNQSLLSGFLPVQLARGGILSVLGSVPPLRAFAMREGLDPGSGLRGAFADLKQAARKWKPASR